MPAIAVRFQDDPVTSDVVEPVLGGQLVEHRAPAAGATQRPVGVAAAGSLVYAGVALIDATPPVAQTGPNLNLVQISTPSATTVAVEGVVPVVYAVAAAKGDLLLAAAGGQVTPVPPVTTPTAADVTNTRAIVGRCMQDGGVAAGAVGFMRILNAS